MTMTPRAVIFDLDGTLLDTLRDLAYCVNETLAWFGFPTHPVEDYKQMVGTGARRLIEISSGRDADPSSVSAEQVDGMLARFSAAYSDRWNRETCPYDGVPEMLRALTVAGVPLAVLSNKADPMTRRMVAHFFPGVPFASVIGQRPGIPNKPDPASALEIAGQIGLDPSMMAYVGDSGSDMTTAHRAGMMAVGVLWGFRDREELETAGAVSLFESPAELVGLFVPGMEE